MSSSTSRDPPDRVLVAAGLLVFGMLMLVCACFLLWFSYLRETHSFWLNSGGYPILLRDVVLVSYYPLLAVSVTGVLGLTIAVLLGPRMPLGFVCFAGLVIIGCWLLLIGSMTVSFTNNFENLWGGRPLHYKPPSSQP